MKVICENYKKCEWRDWCYHAESHELNSSFNNSEPIFRNICKKKTNNIDCYCSTKLLRKQKLETLKNI